MQEYWVNVYWYPKNKLGPYLSNKFATKELAIKFGSKCYNARRIVLYRIHVKMGDKCSRSFYPFVWIDGKARHKWQSEPRKSENNLFK